MFTTKAWNWSIWVSTSVLSVPLPCHCDLHHSRLYPACIAQQSDPYDIPRGHPLGLLMALWVTPSSYTLHHSDSSFKHPNTMILKVIDYLNNNFRTIPLEWWLGSYALRSGCWSLNTDSNFLTSWPWESHCSLNAWVSSPTKWKW